MARLLATTQSQIKLGMPSAVTVTRPITWTLENLSGMADCADMVGGLLLRYVCFDPIHK